MDDLKFPPVGSTGSPQVGGPPANLPVANPSPQNPSGNLPPLPHSFAPTPLTLPVKTPAGPQLPPSAPHPVQPSIKSEITPRSSIRTMESDIKSSQAGQAPKGVEVKPPVFSAVPPKSITPVTSPKPPIFSSTPPTGVKLGEAEKRTSPLPGQIRLPTLSKPEPQVPEIKVGPVIPPPSVSPSLKQPPTPPLKVPPPSGHGGITVPSKPSIFANKRAMAIMAVVVLVFLGGILYWRSGQAPEQISGPTSTPTAASSPAPTLETTPATTLTGIFGQSSSFVFPGLSDSLSTFQSGMVGLSNDRPDKNTLVLVKKPYGENYKLSGFLNQFSISFPVNLTSYIEDSDFNLVLTKQTEFFDQGGKLMAIPSAEDLLTPKISLVVRVVDATETQTQLALWEDTLFDDLSSFYGLEQIEPATFSDNAYQGVAIRFLNFTHPDKTIDYAIITAKNGNDYLVIANSREQIYSIIDKLLGF